MGGSRQVAKYWMIFIVFFVSLSALVVFSPPHGEVAGRRSWTSRREEPALSTSDGRQGDAGMHHILSNRYSLLELIYPGFRLRIFTVRVLTFKLTMMIVRCCQHFFVCVSLSFGHARTYEVVTKRSLHLGYFSSSWLGIQTQ